MNDMIFPSPNLIEALAEIRSRWGCWWLLVRWREENMPKLVWADDLLMFETSDAAVQIRLRDRTEN